MTAAGQQKVTKQSATRAQVLDLIERLGVGTAIPSERQLSADLGVSRLTLRAALDDLAREGYLVRRRGSGTYVQQPKISQELTITSFSRVGRIVWVICSTDEMAGLVHFDRTVP